MISMILGLLLVVIVVRVIVGILVNPGLLLRIVFGFALLVILGIAALAMLIGQFIPRSPHSGISMPGVTVNPTGVHVYNGTGESVMVTPFGVEVSGRAGRIERHTTRHAQRVAANEQVYVLEGAGEAAPAPLGFWKDGHFHEGVAADPSPGVDADTPIHRNRTEAERQTDAEFRRVFEHYLESPLPAAVATESTVQAEAPEEPAAPAAVAEPQRLLADHFDPDVYQSEGAAVRGLTSQVAKILDTVTAGAQEPNPIVIQGKISKSLVLEMQGILAKEFPSAYTHWSKGATQVDDHTVIVYACREPEEGGEGAASRGNSDGSPQVLRMDITGAKGKVSRSARFLDKPWVDDFATFAGNNRGRAWVMAMSPDPAVSAAEAEQRALDAAVAQIEPRVRDRLAYYARSADDSLLQRQIRAGLESSGMIVDRFVQRFERPYGEIWQVGLLVDASAKKIAGLAEACDRVLGVRQRTLRQTVLSIAGLVALVCVVYIFLNSVTKGYFVWSLRAGALAILAGGIFLVLFLSHNRPAIDGFLR